MPPDPHPVEREPLTVEQLACAAWDVTATTPLPTERIDTNGGPLDPEGWCTKAAVAIRDGAPMPDYAKGVSGEPFRQSIIERGRKVLSDA